MRTYELSTLLRGLKGTSGAVSEHVAGDRFALLNGSVKQIECNSEDIGIQQKIKAVTFGELLASAAPIDFVNTGKSYADSVYAWVIDEDDGTWVLDENDGGPVLDLS